MFNSKLSSLIEDAVMDLFAFGRGRASVSIRGTVYDVTAEWAENETDIEITIKENDIVRLTFTEEVPVVFR